MTNFHIFNKSGLNRSNFPLCEWPWLPITSCFIVFQTNPYETNKLVQSAQPLKLSMEALSSSQKTRTVHRLSSHEVRSQEGQRRNREITEETQWRSCGLVYDSGA